jgi:phosphoglycolate phosphatase
MSTLERMNYDLIIWDFDGTIADSLPRMAEIYNEMAAEQGLLPISNTAAARELTIREFLKEHRIPLHKVPFLTGKFLAAQKQHSQPLEVFPGVADVIHELRQSGLRMGVVSSNDPETVGECLRRHNLEECFEFRIGCSRLFGKHRAIRKVVRAAAVPEDRALYVGDETRDIEEARKAGVRAAAVTWGFNSARALLKIGPAHVVNEPGELVALCVGAVSLRL